MPIKCFYAGTRMYDLHTQLTVKIFHCRSLNNVIHSLCYEKKIHRHAHFPHKRSEKFQSEVENLRLTHFFKVNQAFIMLEQ